MSAEPSPENKKSIKSYSEPKRILSDLEANEVFFGVVGHVGSGTGFVAQKLEELLK